MSELAALITQGDAVGVRELLRRKPAVLGEGVPGAPSALLLAAYHGKGEVAEVLRAAMPSLTFHEAAAVGDLHQLEAALAANPNGHEQFSADGFTPLGYAAFFNHPQAVAKLLAAGADPNVAATNPMGVTPLHSALAGGHKELARTLVEAGADVNAASASLWTPAHYVGHNGDLETARYLIARGAKTDGVNADGKTPSDLASGHSELAALLASGR
jgi:ankyrin repeat protein